MMMNDLVMSKLLQSSNRIRPKLQLGLLLRSSGSLLQMSKSSVPKESQRTTNDLNGLELESARIS